MLPEHLQRIVPNSVRFSAEPAVVSDWILFSDIDILYCEGIRSYFKKAIDQEVPYVNIYLDRRYGRCLSGVNCSKWSSMFRVDEGFVDTQMLIWMSVCSFS